MRPWVGETTGTASFGLNTDMQLTSPTEDDIICDPVWPSAGVQNAYYHTLAHQIELMHDAFKLLVLTELAHPLHAVIATDASPVDDIRKALDKFAERWTGRWASMEERIAEKFASGAWTATDNGMRASFKKAGFTVKFNPTRPMLLAYNARVQTNVNLIRSIPQQYLKDVSQQVWDTVTTTGDMNALTEGIQKVYSVTQHRASFIARDQNNKAKASFEQTRRIELGITEAVWQHSGGGKEFRPTHLKAGQLRTVYNILKGWWDKAVGKFILPGEEINCRCTSSAIIPGLKRRKSYQ